MTNNNSAQPLDSEYEQIMGIKNSLMRNVEKIQLLVEIADLFSDKYLIVLKSLFTTGFINEKDQVLTRSSL